MVAQPISGTSQKMAKARQDPPQEDPRRSALGGSPKFGALKPSHVPEKKTKEHCAPWQAGSLDAGRVKAGIWWKLGTQRGDCMLLCEGFLKKSTCELPALGKKEWGGAIPHPPSALTNFSEQNSAT